MRFSKDNLTMRYAGIQFFYWMLFGDVVGFVSVYLLDDGFSNTQIGILLAVSGVLAALLQPVLAGYADLEKSPSLKSLLSVFLVIQLILGTLLILTYHRAGFLTGLFYGCSIIVMQLSTPFVNALGMESMNHKKKLNFGAARGLGSVGYAIAAWLIGVAVARLGSIFLPFSIMTVAAALFLCLRFFPFEKLPKQEAEKTDGGGGVLYFVRKYRRFCITLSGCILIYVSHVLLNSFTIQIVTDKGGGSAQMGTSMAMASLIELPTMFLFAWMLKKFRCDVWFRLSGIFFFLKTLGTLLAPNIPVFYGVQIFQMFGWALITVSSVYYVNSIMEKQDVIKGQAYMTMTYTLGSVIGALLGGALIDGAGVTAMLVFASAAAGTGALIMLFATESNQGICKTPYKKG